MGDDLAKELRGLDRHHAIAVLDAVMRPLRDMAAKAMPPVDMASGIVPNLDLRVGAPTGMSDPNYRPSLGGILHHFDQLSDLGNTDDMFFPSGGAAVAGGGINDNTTPETMSWRDSELDIDPNFIFLLADYDNVDNVDYVDYVDMPLDELLMGPLDNDNHNVFNV